MADANEWRYIHESMIATITAAEQRRQQESSIYLTLISAGIAAASKADFHERLYIAIAMFLVAVVWFAKARSFLHLAKAKWAVITEIEKNFEYAPFTVEWVKIKSTKKKIPRFGLVTLELIVPSIIAIVSIAYILGHFYCYLFER